MSPNSQTGSLLEPEAAEGPAQARRGRGAGDNVIHRTFSGVLGQFCRLKSWPLRADTAGVR